MNDTNDVKCACGCNVEPARVELGLHRCLACASRSDVSRVRGVMNWAHKTGATIQVMSASCFDSQKKYYQPQGARSAVKNFSKHIAS